MLDQPNFYPHHGSSQGEDMEWLAMKQHAKIDWLIDKNGGAYLN